MLNAIALLDTELGYVQSMNFVAGVLLQELNEENCFYMMVYIMQHLDWRKVLIMSNGHLQNLIDNIEEVLQTEDPTVCEHLNEQTGQCLLILFMGNIMPIFTGLYPEINIT